MDDEPYFYYMWRMDVSDTPKTWNLKKSKVFILDSGINPMHLDLALNLNTTLSTSFFPDEMIDRRYLDCLS